MQAIVLAAGEGSRLRPLTATKPKPMIPVANKPILQFVLEALQQNGVTDVTVVVGYQRERVQSFFEDGKRFGLRIQYAFQEALLGTAHALTTVPTPTADFLVLGGDNIVDAALVKDVLNAPGPVALAATHAANPSKYGVVAMNGTGVVSGIEEQPPGASSNVVNTGVYRMTPDFHEYLKRQVAQGVTGLTHVIQNAIQDEKRDVHAVRSRGLWMDALYPWDVLDLTARLVTSEPEKRRTGVHASAVLEGPHVIGADTVVGAHAVVEPTTTLGANCVVGAQCVITNSVIGDDVQIGPGSVITNSIIADGTRIGPRFTALSGPSDVKVRDGWHPLQDFGAVIGEDCVIGGNVTVTPGRFIGNHARVGNGVTIRENVDDEAVVQ